MDTVTAIATIVIAVATGFAAFGAMRAARATSDTVAAQLFQQLMTEYASPEMGEALEELRRQSATLADQPGAPSAAEARERWARITTSPGHASNSLNAARRRVSHFFAKTARILDAGLISGSLRQELEQLAGLDLVHRLVSPLNQALAVQLGTEEKNQETVQLLRRVLPNPRGHSNGVPSNTRVELTQRS
jgi:hypothetical protein